MGEPVRQYFFAVDESEGTGKGYDRFYFDLNQDLDLSSDQPLKPQGPAAVNQIPIEVKFEAFSLSMSSGRSGGGAEMKLVPIFAHYGEYGNLALVHFASTTARKGKIKLGSEELEVVLAQDQFNTSSYNNPNTRMHIISDFGMNTYLGSMRKIDGKFYSFSNSMGIAHPTAEFCGGLKAHPA